MLPRRGGSQHEKQQDQHAARKGAFRDRPHETVNRVRRDASRSVPELVAAIEDYIRLLNEMPKPFMWTAKANDILEKVKRGRVVLDKLQSA